MIKRKGIIILLLLLLLIKPWTAFSQHSAKDTATNYCLSDIADRRNINNLAFDEAKCDSVNKSLIRELQGTKSINILNSVLLENNNKLFKRYDEMHEQDLQDINLLKNDVHSRDKKIRNLKIGIFSVGIVGTATTIFALVKK